MSCARVLSWPAWRTWLCCQTLAPAAQRLEVTIHDSINTVDAELWRGINRNASFFVEHAYLSLFERHAPATLSFRYAVVSYDQAPVAALAFQVLDVSTERMLHDEAQALPQGLTWGRRRLEQIKLAVRHKALAMMQGRLLICGNLFSNGLHGVAVAPGIDSDVALQMVVDAIMHVEQQESALKRIDYILFKDVYGEHRSLKELLAAKGFWRLPTEPDMTLYLEPRWHSYNDYVDALNAKYRKAARKVFDQVAQGGGTIESCGDLRPVASELHRLYLQVAEKAKIRYAEFPPEYLPELAAMVGENNLRCTLIRVDGRIAGFSTTLRDGPGACAYYLGFDYEANANMPIYLRLLHAVIADAIEMRCSKISFGRTALEPKSRLGGKPENMEIWMKHRSALVNKLVQPFLRMIPQEQPPVREPFKN